MTAEIDELVFDIIVQRFRIDESVFDDIISRKENDLSLELQTKFFKIDESVFDHILKRPPEEQLQIAFAESTDLLNESEDLLVDNNSKEVNQIQKHSSILDNRSPTIECKELEDFGDKSADLPVGDLEKENSCTKFFKIDESVFDHILKRPEDPSKRNSSADVILSKEPSFQDTNTEENDTDLSNKSEDLLLNNHSQGLNDVHSHNEKKDSTIVTNRSHNFENNEFEDSGDKSTETPVDDLKPKEIEVQHTVAVNSHATEKDMIMVEKSTLLCELEDAISKRSPRQIMHINHFREFHETSENTVQNLPNDFEENFIKDFSQGIPQSTEKLVQFENPSKVFEGSSESPVQSPFEGPSEKLTHLNTSNRFEKSSEKECVPNHSTKIKSRKRRHSLLLKPKKIPQNVRKLFH